MAREKSGMIIAPILAKPAGKSDRGWCNTSLGTSRDGVLCQLCGTALPEPHSDESYALLRFLGLQAIEQCCGRVIDVVYAEWGEDFTTAFLEDFAENPTDPRFILLQRILPDILRRAQMKIEETSKVINKCQQIMK